VFCQTPEHAARQIERWAFYFAREMVSVVNGLWRSAKETIPNGTPGWKMSRATLCGWVMRIGELLRPISRAMAKELLGDDYLQADETPVGVQMHDGRGNNHQAYLWQ
jgi:hypothetical protein